MIPKQKEYQKNPDQASTKQWTASAQNTSTQKAKISLRPHSSENKDSLHKKKLLDLQIIISITRYNLMEGVHCQI